MHASRETLAKHQFEVMSSETRISASDANKVLTAFDRTAPCPVDSSQLYRLSRSNICCLLIFSSSSSSVLLFSKPKHTTCMCYVRPCRARDEIIIASYNLEYERRSSQITSKLTKKLASSADDAMKKFLRQPRCSAARWEKHAVRDVTCRWRLEDRKRITNWFYGFRESERDWKRDFIIFRDSYTLDCLQLAKKNT